MHPVKIIDNLYLGNRSTGQNLMLLKKHKIIAILAVGCNKLMYESDFKYLKLNILDSNSANISNYLDDAMKFICENIKNGNVLVHCQGGISRSPAFIIAYLAKYHNMTVTGAINHVKKIRKAIRPRQKFLDDIEIWLNLNKTK